MTNGVQMSDGTIGSQKYYAILN